MPEHGWTKRQTWRKLHLGMDADTDEITAENLTEASVDDALAGTAIRYIQATPSAH